MPKCSKQEAYWLTLQRCSHLKLKICLQESSQRPPSSPCLWPLPPSVYEVSRVASLCSLWFPFSASVLHFQGPPGYAGPSWITQDGLCVSQSADHRLDSIYNLCHATQSVHSFQEPGCWLPWGHVVLPTTCYLANISANLMCFSWNLDDKVSHTPFSLMNISGLKVTWQEREKSNVVSRGLQWPCTPSSRLNITRFIHQ